ncbi:PLCXc domain containing protein [Pyrenophora tritici-repentis]|uniref:PLCXc domain containing protein n=2 Tax=Pyrenophora tritici-repentis TaxID=45151 RepID=A0A2W1D9D9_9PLEO|nr:PLCXc domain-containing protein [Pyrenophora tritici-repentis]KAF7443859.1 PLCXc domain containing protein [Pyrenophora tritici-repentis]KAF7566414.1 PLCXc domain containing protein [Pyrenophora tritici-repentis]KAG9379598.1 PLCXc domain containing protein [Pyrenophora tritici-repentis]KAI0575888.1 PLCXc domain-containing protein [Pyrenophora tritici-repentis]
MGWGGSITLVNASPFDWTLSGSHSYQMDTWQWPTISAGMASSISVEFSTRGHTSDDAGEAYYNIDRTSEKFTILARKPSDYELTISLDNMSTKQNPKGTNVNLGFRHNAAVNWILSTDAAGTWWSNSGTYTDWMQQSMGSLANRTLKHICMPGSHDAGMGAFHPGTIGAHFANTQTQYLDFAGQLKAGSRYFDLRPVISRGDWVTGHYSSVGDIWLGGNGQSLSEIIQQINDFTSKYQELIIINLSHTLDTDNAYKELSQAQWNALFTTLQAIKNRHIVANPGNTDFSNSRLADFITDRAAVLIVAELPDGITLGSFANQGFYSTTRNLPTYNEYSNSNNLASMKTDQIAKLKANRNIVASNTERKDVFHIFSWTLTQQPEDVLNFDKAVMNMAATAFDQLVSDAWNAFTPQSFPNVLFVDSLGVRDKSVVFPFDKPRGGLPVNADIAALAVAVNNGVAGRNGVVTGR